MAAATIPSGGISLHGAPNSHDSDSSTFARSAVLLHLNEQVIRDIKQCSQAGKTVQLLAGKSPRLRIGSKSLDIRVTPETFRHELYTSQGASHDYSFTALITQQADLKTTEKVVGDTAGADAALAALKQNLASYAQEKQAKQATISTSVLPGSRKGASMPNSLLRPNSLLHANRSQLSNPSLHTSTPRSSAGPTSAPMTNTQHAVQKALVHLLAVKPLSVEDIVKKTRIPKDSCVALLKKVGQQDSPNSGWCLANKMFKDLDVWNFNYQKEEDRQKAIDNAVRAYDRLRVEKQNYLWQKLLPVEERGKGKILSRLPTSNEIDKVGTPGAGATPLPSGDDVAGKTLNARGTPSLEPKTTPRMGATAIGRGGIKIGKLLKDSKKKHAAEEAKEKKRREKEAAASDMEGRVSKPREIPKNQVKRMQAKKPVVKSAEVVHSSEEDEGEIVEHAERPTKDTTGGLQQSNKEAKPKPLATEPRKVNGPSSQSRTKPRSGTLSDSSDTSARSASQAKPKAAAPPKDRFTPSVTKKSEQLSAASAARAKDLPASKETPLQRPVKKVSATASSQQTQLSPKKGNTKPTNPSPLGATRPRNASDVSEKPATGSLTSSKVTKPTAPPATAKIAKAGTANSRPAEASGAQKQPPVSKKRALQDDGGTADPPRKAAKGTPSSIARSAEVPRTNGHTTNTDNQLKRKANDLSACSHSPLPKHRKTDSRASSSLATTTARTSPDNEGWQSEHSSSASSTVQLSWERALDESDKFRNEYYPAYTKLYDRLQGMDPADVTEEDAHKLWRMHHRLQQMKKEIRLAREDE